MPVSLFRRNEPRPPMVACYLALLVKPMWRYLGFGLIFVLEATFAADPATIARHTRDWRLQHEKEVLREFVNILAIPNVANDARNIRRNAELISAMFGKRGLTAQLLTVENVPPIVVADLVAPGAKRTIAFYAHYDGQPVDPTRWKSDPWKPVIREKQKRANLKGVLSK